MLQNYRFKHICNDDIGIGHRKQQKLAYRIFTMEIFDLVVAMSVGHAIVMTRQTGHLAYM